MRKAIFLDRDGCLNKDIGYPHKVEDFELLPGVIEGLKKLKDEFIFIIITNQSGIGKGIFSEDDMHAFNEKLLDELSKEGIEIKKIYFCAHSPEHGCDCRKPHTKFMREAASKFNVDLKESWMIGDHPHDVEMALKAGAKGIYLLTGHGNKHKSELHSKGIRPSFIAKNFLEAANFILSKNENLKTINQNKRTNKKIRTIDEIEKLANDLRKKNKKIVTTNGVFDILHIGHIRYLQQARSLGDVFIVGVNVDSSVKQNKGDKRPLNNENDRAEQLAALECIDYVVLFSEKTPIELLEKIKPAVHVKGGDYSMDRIIEKDVVKKNGGRVILIPKIEGYSTTKLIDKVIAVYGKK